MQESCCWLQACRQCHCTLGSWSPRISPRIPRRHTPRSILGGALVPIGCGAAAYRRRSCLPLLSPRSSCGRGEKQPMLDGGEPTPGPAPENP